MSPSQTQIEEILKALSSIANVKAITWAGWCCYVELWTGDGRVYEPRSLPGRVAGRTTIYHHSENDLWEDVRDQHAGITNHAHQGTGTGSEPGPGILHLGGILGTNIIRLVRSNEIVDGSWCSANSLSTGVVFFQCAGIRATEINITSSPEMTLKYDIERVFDAFNPSRGSKIQNLRGVPMVEESSLLEGLRGGGVYGFFRDGDYEMAFCTVLDDIVDAGWELTDCIPYLLFAS